jgi:hypothetical protein
MIVEAQPWHVGQIVRRLRTEHRSLLVGMGVSAHRELRDAYEASMWRKAWIVEGRLMGIAGITGTVSSGDGNVWLAVSEEALKRPVSLARLVLRHLEEAMQIKRHLTTIVLKDDRAAVRFAYFLGFHVEEQTTINGAVAMIMVLDTSVRMVA